MIDYNLCQLLVEELIFSFLKNTYYSYSSPFNSTSPYRTLQEFIKGNKDYLFGVLNDQENIKLFDRVYHAYDYSNEYDFADDTRVGEIISHMFPMYDCLEIEDKTEIMEIFLDGVFKIVETCEHNFNYKEHNTTQCDNCSLVLPVDKNYCDHNIFVNNKCKVCNYSQ
jgi:hypothetical protein